MIPEPVERRAGEALAEAVRAGPRHPRRPGRARDAAGFEQRGEKDTLPGGRPLAAGRVDGIGCASGAREGCGI